ARQRELARDRLDLRDARERVRLIRSERQARADLQPRGFPVQFGVRFCAKARGPSTKSSLRNRSPMAGYCPLFIASSRFAMFRLRMTVCLVARIEAGEHSRIWCAQPLARSMSSACGA